MIIFGDLKESLFAATKTLVDEELKELTNLSTDRYEAEYIEKSIEFQNSILPIVEQLYKNGFFDEVLNPTIDTESIYEYTNVDYEERRYSVLLENTDSAVRGKYLDAKMCYAIVFDTIDDNHYHYDIRQDRLSDVRSAQWV